MYSFYSAWFSDHSKGFGGKYGVQTDRVDKSAYGFEHQEKLEQHDSQKGNVKDLSILTLFLAHLAKGNVSFCHHLAFVIRHLSSVNFSHQVSDAGSGEPLVLVSHCMLNLRIDYFIVRRFIFTKYSIKVVFFGYRWQMSF